MQHELNTSHRNGSLGISHGVEKMQPDADHCSDQGSQGNADSANAVAERDAQSEIDDGLTDGGDPTVSLQSVAGHNHSVRKHGETDDVGDGEDFQEKDAVAGIIGPDPEGQNGIAVEQERQAEMMEGDPSLGGVFSDAELIDDASAPIGKRLWDSILFMPRDRKRFQAASGIDVLLRCNVVTGATLMVRASLRSLFMPIPTTWVHDGWIALQTVFYAQLRSVEEPLLEYRIHANQQIGIKNSTHFLPPTLRERLEKGKREEPGNQLAHAHELNQLAQWMSARKDARSEAALLAVRRTSRFYADRAGPYTSRLAHLASILRNTANYHRYEDGWRCLVRDIVLVFI